MGSPLPRMSFLLSSNVSMHSGHTYLLSEASSKPSWEYVILFLLH